MPMATTLPAGVEVLADAGEAGERILTPDALEFVATLQRELGPAAPSCSSDGTSGSSGSTPASCPISSRRPSTFRDDPSWRVAEAPADLQDRRVEITGRSTARW